MGNCFVIMGFGEKTDFQSNPQRVLNLDRTYEDIIKPVVEEAGHICIRADEIIHSTVIDKPMYDNLLSADLVIADLSTANVNAAYELGVRHALRPERTIVLAEKNFSFPFDLNHLSILKYEHLGKEIGFKEVMRVRGISKKRSRRSWAVAIPTARSSCSSPRCSLPAFPRRREMVAAGLHLPPPANSPPPSGGDSPAPQPEIPGALLCADRPEKLRRTARKLPRREGQRQSGRRLGPAAGPFETSEDDAA